MIKRFLAFMVALILAAGLTTATMSNTAYAAMTWEWVIEPTWVSVKTNSLGGYVHPITEGLICIGRDEKWGVNDWGLVDLHGNTIVPFKYHDVGPFYEGLAVVMTIGGTRESGRISNSSHRYGVIDTKGNVVIPIARQGLTFFSEGLIGFKPDNGIRFVMPGGEWGYMDIKGNVVIPAVYDAINPFSEGLAAVVQDNKMGFIDKSGNVVIPFEYVGSGTYSNEPGLDLYDNGNHTRFKDGLAVVELPGNYPYKKVAIDKNGNIVINFEDYEYFERFSEGFAVKKRGGEWDFIDKNGNQVTPFEYDSASSFIVGYDWTRPFYEGLAAVEKDEKCGFIDKSGNVVLPVEFDRVSDVSDGLALVQKDGLWGVVRFVTIVTVTFNGQPLDFDQPPIIENGRTLVPLRTIFEAMGATVDWNDDTQTVTAVKDDITVSLIIGSNILIKNGKNITLDVPAQLVNGRTLVPARAVAESFGATVNWEGDTQTVLIKY